MRGVLRRIVVEIILDSKGFILQSLSETRVVSAFINISRVLTRNCGLVLIDLANCLMEVLTFYSYSFLEGVNASSKYNLVFSFSVC